MRAAPFPRLFHRSPGGLGGWNTKDVDKICMFPRSLVFPYLCVNGRKKTQVCPTGGGH